jgi:hypothetical protein
MGGGEAARAAKEGASYARAREAGGAGAAPASAVESMSAKARTEYIRGGRNVFSGRDRVKGDGHVRAHGNGPSVRTEDLDRLQGRLTFAFNRFHLAHGQTRLRPTYTLTGDRQMIEDFGQQIDRLPGLRDELTQAANARRAEARVRTDEQTLRRDLGTDTEPGRSVVGRFARYDASRADDALQEVLRDPQPGKAADDLLNFVGNKPEAVAGVRRVFWERMEGKARASGETTASTDGVQPWSPTRL